METAKQNTQQNIEENDALKQFMGLLNRQGMGEQSQDFMELFQYVAGMQLQLAMRPFYRSDDDKIRQKLPSGIKKAPCGAWAGKASARKTSSLSLSTRGIPGRA